MSKYAGRVLRVRNLPKYQHYKDRTPPWIKLHQETLEDYDFAELPDATKYHALAIMLLASRTENSLPDDAAWIGKKINAKTRVDLAALLSAEFLEVYQDASGALADCEQPATIEESRGEKRERRGEKRGAGALASPPLPAELDKPAFRVAWERRLKERGETTPSKRPTTSQLEAQLAKLVKVAAARGLDYAISCVERATENGYQGVVFPEDMSGGNGAPPPATAFTPGPVVADYGGVLKAKLNSGDPNERPLTREEWGRAHPDDPWPGAPPS